VEADIASGCYVLGRHEELAQMIVNLVINAADACEEADRARGSHERMSRRARLSVVPDGNRVAVVVEDSGTGVPASLRGRIFDPFFTTKQEATGIGLTLARQAVVAHGGHIELAPSKFGGALFRVLLPADAIEIRVPSEPATAPPRARVIPSKRPRIAWIDDDEIFLRAMKRILHEWDIVSAQSAAEAEALLAREPVELVFCDVGLPDGSGHLVHATVKEVDAGLASRFVFVTGGVITPEVADYLIASGCPTLLKPVNVEEIRAMLEGDESSDAATPVSARTLQDPTSTPPARLIEEAATSVPCSPPLPEPVDEPSHDRRKDDTVREGKKRRRDSQ